MISNVLFHKFNTDCGVKAGNNGFELRKPIPPASRRRWTRTLIGWDYCYPLAGWLQGRYIRSLSGGRSLVPNIVVNLVFGSR